MTDKTDSKEREDVELSRACVKAWDSSGFTSNPMDAVHPMFSAAFELGYRASAASNGFDAADMATASAQGFRDGVASLAASAASAGSEPVAWRAQFDAWWARNRVSTHQVKNIGGFAAKVWHAAIKTVVGATDSTAGFYPADEGSTPSRQATHPSPPEGMVMVPKEPTHHMLNAAASAYEDARQSLGAYNAPWAAYRAMLEVAAPPTSSADSRKGD